MFVSGLTIYLIVVPSFIMSDIASTLYTFTVYRKVPYIVKELKINRYTVHKIGDSNDKNKERKKRWCHSAIAKY